METKKYRLIGTSTVVEAVYLHPRDTDPYEVAHWCNGEVVIPAGKNYTGGPLVVRFISGFSSGYDTVGVGSYLVKVPGGEFFARSKGVFEEQYEIETEPDVVPEEDHNTRLPSHIWQDLFGIVVRDPDGWDRTNYDASWAEYITEEEFIHRASRSTIMMDNKVKRPVLPHFYEVRPHA